MTPRSSGGLVLLLLTLTAWAGAWAQEEVYVANTEGHSITVYNRTAAGDTAPLRMLAGPATGLSAPIGVAVDAVHDELVVTNFGNSVTVYARTASGNAAPLRTLAGPATGLSQPQGVAVDLINDELSVVNTGNDSITVYGRAAQGNAPPLRTLAGLATGLSDPFGVAVDPVHDELVVANAFGNSVTVYSRTASGNTPPLRTLVLGPGNGPVGVALDLVHDELVVALQASAILAFPRTASGNALPLRLRDLSGQATQLCGPTGVILDLVHDELVAVNAFSDCRSVTAYPRLVDGNIAPTRRLAGAASGLSGPRFGALTTSPPLAAAVLPGSRSVQVGTAAGAFAAIINAGAGPAMACAPTPITTVPATFAFQTTDPQNQLVGTANAPANIPPGGTQHFVFAFTPTAPFGPSDVQLGFACANTNRAPVIAGVSTLLLSASATPVPDVIAAAATVQNDGIVSIPGPTGVGAFAVATANVGAASLIDVAADTGTVSLPVALSVCETVPATGACVQAPAASVRVSMSAGDTRTFAVFVGGLGVVTFDPAVNRVFVRFRDPGGLPRGATSVAARTQ